MTIQFFMDVHVPRAIADGLRSRGIDVLTAQEDGAEELPDPELLDRATNLKRVLVTQDQDFLEEDARRQASGALFAGIIYVHQLKLTIGQLVNELELIGKAGEPEDLLNLVEFLPLK